MAAPLLPEQAQRELDDMAKKFLICIHTQAYDDALETMRSLYKRMLDWQREYGKRFHKGYAIHNIGYTLFLENKHQEALKYFISAYIEDLLSADDENQADSTPAGQTLLLGYRYNADVLNLLKQTVSKLKREAKIPLTPEEVVKQLVHSQPACEKDLEGKITVRLAHRTLRKFTEFQSDWTKRVFIGGSGGLHPIIELIRRKVAQLGYDPVVAIDFDMPNGMTIYHKCLALLHSCKYAIFDLSEQAGQLLELERAPEYGIKTLVVWPRAKEGSITEMLRSILDSRGITYKSYDDFSEMDSIFRSFLDKTGTV